jgi:hypothetical protein
MITIIKKQSDIKEAIKQFLASSGDVLFVDPVTHNKLIKKIEKNNKNKK